MGYEVNILALYCTFAWDTLLTTTMKVKRNIKRLQYKMLKLHKVIIVSVYNILYWVLLMASGELLNILLMGLYH